jgi:hypothetical protein
LIYSDTYLTKNRMDDSHALLIEYFHSLTSAASKNDSQTYDRNSNNDNMEKRTD